MCVFVLTSVILTACLGTPRELAPPPHELPLVHAGAVRSLSVAEASRRRPVRITGMVTFVNSSQIQDFFVQDSTAGIYVKPTKMSAGLAPGDLITVEGVSDPGDFAPCVEALSIRRLARRQPLPAPLPFNLLAEDGRWLDSQRVQVRCIVSKVDSNDRFTILHVYTAHGRGRLLIPDPSMAKIIHNLNDAALNVQAICVPRFDPVQRIVLTDETILYSNSLPSVALMSEDAHRTQAIDHLFRFTPIPHPGARRVIVSGVVVGQFNHWLFVQDPTCGISAELEESAPARMIGRRVEVRGLVSFEANRLLLTHATVKDLGPAEMPMPREASLESLAQGLHYAQLVTTTGRIEEIRQRDDHRVLILVDGVSRLEVIGPLSLSPPLGAQVQVLGAVGRTQSRGLAANKSVLVLRSEDDLQVLAHPPPAPWWSTSRIVMAIAIPATLATGALAWIITLRRRISAQTRALHTQYETQRELEDKLRTSQKLEAIGRLAGGIAHDFNNLLTVINGCSELLTQDSTTSTSQRDLARDIRTAGERAASLVSQLLLFSRRQSVKPHPVDLRATIRDAERILKRVIGETITVECNTPPDTPMIRGEETLLHQILLNLAVNARDAMPIGGTLRIATRSVQTERGPMARLIVSDTGLGMDETTRARIFEPFFTTKNVGEGTGLGLATVYGIVQTLEGEIRCRSVKGQGTTFEIDFPALANDLSASEVKSSSSPIQSRRGTILLCEDDNAVRLLTCRVLEGEGYKVLAAEDPLQALEIAKTHPDSIELLLSDLVMPEMNGSELATRILAIRPELRVVFISGYNSEDIARSGISPDQFEIISKPFSPTALKTKIHSLFDVTRNGTDPTRQLISPASV